jgi:DNA-binding NtrC family response regulator
LARILAIDDEENILRLLKIMLTDAGHEVVTAMDGQAGLKCMAANKFDLVITDIVMPVTEGIETIQYLRRITATLPILAISGGGRFGNLDMLQAAKKLGATATLPKPFLKDDLLQIVGDLLQTPG